MDKINKHKDCKYFVSETSRCTQGRGFSVSAEGSACDSFEPKKEETKNA